MATTLSQALAWWSSYYGNHQALSVTIRFVHLAALLVGGGTAIAIDRQTLRGHRVSPEVQHATLAMLNAAHSVVIVSLGLIISSGLLMAGADVETYLASATFWTKMGLVTLLLGNGALLVRAGRSTAAAANRRLAIASAVSMVLWVLIVYVSSWLMVAA